MRAVRENDPIFMKAYRAEHHCCKMQAQHSEVTRPVKSVDVFINPKLIKAFKKQKKQFAKQGINSNPVYGYHVTNPSSILSIVG